MFRVVEGVRENTRRWAGRPMTYRAAAKRTARITTPMAAARAALVRAVA